MNEFPEVSIVVCFDLNYAKYGFLTVASAIENARNYRKIIVYLVGAELDESNKSAFEKLKRSNVEFVDIKITQSDLAGVPVSGHISIAAYYRVLLPRVLPECCKKVLYLDCDILVLGNICQLWDINLHENVYVAAVENPDFNRHTNLKMEKSMAYFNSGVMLINMALWREQDVAAKTLNILRENPGNMRFWDQDALNSAIQGQWTSIEVKWNVQTSMLRRPRYYRTLGNEIAIIHFSSNIKPWQARDCHPFATLYRSFAERHGIRFNYTKPTFAMRIRKCLRWIRSFMLYAAYTRLNDVKKSRLACENL